MHKYIAQSDEGHIVLMHSKLNPYDISYPTQLSPPDRKEFEQRLRSNQRTLCRIVDSLVKMGFVDFTITVKGG